MKKNSIFNTLAIFGTVFISCNPFQQAGVNTPKIYGLAINLNGSGGNQIVDINYNTGIQSNPRSLGIPTSVYGVARNYVQASGQNQGIVTAVEQSSSACGGGTAFYSVNLNTGFSQKLGVAINKMYVTDIEYNPIDNKLYGIYNDVLIRVDNFGACTGTTPAPALITELGKISHIGSGPYSIYFDQLGICYIISGKEHFRAIVQIPVIGNPSSNLSMVGPILADASWNIPIGNASNVASCMAGTTQVIGVQFPNTPSGEFYHFGNPSWNKKGNPWQTIDYTSWAGLR